MSYVGSTRDLRKRLQEHNCGKSHSTKIGQPWRLIYYEAFAKEPLARLREHNLKHNGNAVRELKKRAGANIKVVRGKSHNMGFLTLEIMIALVLVTLSITAVVLVAFGNQALLVGGETHREATQKAQAMLEETQALARKDFNLVNPSGTTTDGIYRKRVDVTFSASEPFTKKITARVSWQNEHNVTLETNLTAFVTNFLQAAGGDTCSSVLTGDWEHPQIVNTDTDLATLSGGTAGDYLITQLNAYKGKLYVTSNNSSVNKETFFIFNLDDPAHPTLIAKRDNDVNATGLNSVTVAESTSDSNTYAYVASASSFPKGQLQIFDVSDASSPHLVDFQDGSVVFKIATTTVAGGSGNGVGKSIFYKDGYVYLGLTKPAFGPEFNIIDVHEPTNPFWIGGFTVGDTVNAIRVSGNYAYLALATQNDQELIILDVSNPASPTQVGGFNATGAGSGKSTYMVGDDLYFGKTAPNLGPEFYVLHIGTSTQPQMIGSEEIGRSVNGLIVRDSLAFLLTNSEFRILNIADPSIITPFASPLSLPGSGSSGGSSLDCEGNVFYAGTNTNGKLYVITSTP